MDIPKAELRLLFAIRYFTLAIDHVLQGALGVRLVQLEVLKHLLVLPELLAQRATGIHGMRTGMFTLTPSPHPMPI
jgi:hypothetical protein